MLGLLFVFSFIKDFLREGMSEGSLETVAGK